MNKHGLVDVTETLKQQWTERCVSLAQRPADLWSHGTQKILHHRKFTFTLDDSLQVEDVGFTDKKMGDLNRLYIDAESRASAVALWDDRRHNGDYGSVAFSTCAHFFKGATKQGPCMLSVAITQRDNDEVSVDVHYRTVEFYKKFVADIVFLRDTLLDPFDLRGMSVEVTCHFSNITAHPMYWACPLAHLDDPIEAMESIRAKDPKFHRHLVKATAEYLLPERGTSIAKHAQSLRVKAFAATAFDPATLKELQKYLRFFLCSP